MRWIERIRIKKNHFLIEVRSSFRGQRKKELFTFFIFLVIASFFWLLQWMKESIETDFMVPIEVINVPKNMLLTSDLPKSLNINVKDKGATIMSYYFSRPIPSYKIDFRSLKIERGVASVASDVIIASVRKKFVASIEIISVFPETLTLHFSRGESKSIPVSLLTSITTSSSSGLSGSLRIFPSHITVYAPSDKLKEISRVYTEAIILNNLNDSITTTVRLQKIDGVRLVPDQIKVLIPIEPFTEKKMEVPVEGIGAPAGFTMRIFPIKVSLVCYVAIDNYNRIKPSDFKLGVDFSAVGASSSAKYPVKLLKSPVSASKIRFQPDEVEVLMEETR